MIVWFFVAAAFTPRRDRERARPRSRGVARDVETAVGGVRFAAGYHPEFLGEYAAQQESSRRLLLRSILALASIYLILHADFGTVRLLTPLSPATPRWRQ